MSRSILILSAIAVISLTLVVPGQRTRTSFKGKSQLRSDAVKFESVNAYTDGKGVLIRWSTSYEREILGFRVFRYTGSGWEKLGYNLVPGAYFSRDPKVTRNRDYRFFDIKGGLNSPYLVQSLSTSGSKVSSKVIYPKFDNSLYSPDGEDSTSMLKAALSSDPIITSKVVNIPKGTYKQGSVGPLTPDPVNQFWVASKPGVKIGVSEEGIYRVTRTELENAGFDVNTDPGLWQLYLNGNEQSIIVEPSGNYIEFYGKGVDEPATNKNIYFLLVGDGPGARMAGESRPSTGPGVETSYREEFYRRDRTIYVPSITNGDKENFFGQVISPTPADVTLQLDDIDFSSLKSTLKVGLQGFTGVAHTVSVSVNGMPFGNISFNGEGFEVADIGVPTQYLVNGSNTITLAGVGGSSDISVVEFVAASYKRAFVARNNELAFPIDVDKAVSVSAFSESSVRVFDITSPDSPLIVNDVTVDPALKLGTQYTATIPANSAGLMYAVSDSALRSADSIVYNEPSTFSSVSNDWQMVIIAYGTLKAESDTWAAYRETNGITAVAADVEDIYDEFDYGRRGPTAIREFINYARLNWASAPGYIMLVGEASYDPRNYTGGGFKDFMPTQIIETTYSETGSDEAMADYNNDGLSEVAIGRVPAKNSTQVTDALTKVQTFESSIATAPPRGVMCASDITQIVDFAALCDRVISGLPMTIPRTYVNKADVDAHTTLIAEMNLGKYIINYSGHGSTNAWTSGGFFGNGDVASLTNVSDLTIYTMLTCLNGYYLDPASDSLSEKLFRATNGGAVATWASSGETTPDVQETLGTRFYDQLGNNASLDRLGDLVKDAKTAVVASRDVRLSWTLFGDPAMKVK